MVLIRQSCILQDSYLAAPLAFQICKAVVGGIRRTINWTAPRRKNDSKIRLKHIRELLRQCKSFSLREKDWKVTVVSTRRLATLDVVSDDEDAYILPVLQPAVQPAPQAAPHQSARALAPPAKKAARLARRPAGHYLHCTVCTRVQLVAFSFLSCPASICMNYSAYQVRRVGSAGL